ncbi:4a-hydroxytetrahydrobiopterin dehydratase [Candidatus Roizmanbacteria bacterium RIFCSPLOWO2_01_FULL_38_12]|uniref:4a-hydroxytetrahydrobiopterin dehydratase n=1 Tax=Candidatus Roizmanbacteria bacterium RIFCSPLOWO2_01_FULL_38_12 TaxID=1802061 RepID=A0A1F7J003_9BACT|nr:MAG: 4a-hydroxytetrahydrobiopterin dehydratase [Candidatus Roizmanbacteria bacterium RIFCSPHIGHO2_01_FULL_38_15]OGK36170.1 MAG: 4a-hydroxytetrahydrobiopterin dehydratase [Candidatus Roizmanbacteria bacterium RIFCSPHIGHO2_12_FULL_38_13]OGK48938.1 MAG: 4a-hydroxytetrahydrobiopterin dehydratase [Candidatus Roizmanbacteria bacterium RIFCSPLOWO2_01_FULL_38_12]
MNSSQIDKFSPQVPEWAVVDQENIAKLMRKFKFKNFAESISFADKVGELAEKNGHHPRLIVDWGKVTVLWWTHAVKGLHRNDFIMAAKTDALS